jgi:outer membrane murein-binding lipoprotein Lpp
MKSLMEKSRLKFPVLFIVLAVIVVGVLTYVSVLGENHKINRVISNYFDTLKNGAYLEANKNFSSNFQFQDERFSNDVRPLAAAMARLDEDFKAERLDKQIYQEERKALEARIQEILDHFNFLLELSLLQYYDLVDQYDYKIELKRKHFWVPFLSDDSVQVSVLLRRKKDKSIADTLSPGRTSNFIDDLIVVVREKRTWKIRYFNITDSAIADIYADVRQNTDINKYTTKTTNGFRLQDADINFKTLTPIDKRLLRFSLYRINKSLDPPDKKDKETSMYPSF